MKLQKSSKKNIKLKLKKLKKLFIILLGSGLRKTEKNMKDLTKKNGPFQKQILVGN